MGTPARRGHPGGTPDRHAESSLQGFLHPQRNTPVPLLAWANRHMNMYRYGSPVRLVPRAGGSDPAAHPAAGLAGAAERVGAGVAGGDLAVRGLAPPLEAPRAGADPGGAPERLHLLLAGGGRGGRPLAADRPAPQG